MGLSAFGLVGEVIDLIEGGWAFIFEDFGGAIEGVGVLGRGLKADLHDVCSCLCLGGGSMR